MVSAQAMGRVLERRLDAAVERLVLLSGGASRETWTFKCRGRELVLQVARRDSDHDALREASVLRTVAAAGVPVPPVVDASNDKSLFGGPFLVTAFVSGETIARKILRDAEYAAARTRLVAQLGEALARLHAIPLSEFENVSEFDPLERVRDEMDAIAAPHPAFELALQWLEDHYAADAPRGFVHGDFRLGNVIVGGDGLRAVLDWEWPFVAPPAADLGWLCMKAWRFGGEGHVAGLGSLEDLLAAYEQAGGARLDAAQVRWWETWGTLRWGVGCVAKAREHLFGGRRSHELAAIGRRACENEYDVLRLILEEG